MRPLGAPIVHVSAWFVRVHPPEAARRVDDGERATSRLTAGAARLLRADRTPAILLVAILAGAAWLRLSAAGLGHPFLSFQPDEDWNVRRGLMIGSGDLDPHAFFYPALWWELLAVADRLVFAVGHALGLLGGWGDFARLVESHPLPFFVGRLLSVAIGTGTVGVVYVLGRRLFAPAHGLVAATFLAGTFLHVRDSALATVDAALTLFVVLSLLGAARVLQEGRARDYLLAGTAAALATAVKYNGVLVLVALVVAHGLRVARAGSLRSRLVTRLVAAPRLLGAELLAGLVFLGLNPFLLLDWRDAWGSPGDDGTVRWEWGYIHTGQYLDVGPAWWYHLTISLRYGLGLALLSLALAGILRALWRRDAGGLLLVSFAALFFAALGSLSAVFVRYMTPLTPVLCLLAADALLALTRRLPWARLRPWVTAGLALLALVEPVDASASYGRLMHHLDTRLEAYEFIQTALPPDTAVATYGPSVTWRSTIPRWLPTMYANPEDQSWATALAVLKRRHVRYFLTHHSRLDVFSPTIPELEQAVARSATLVREFNPYKRGTHPSPVYDRVDAYYFPVGRFRGLVEPGPLIRLYRLN